MEAHRIPAGGAAVPEEQKGDADVFADESAARSHANGPARSGLSFRRVYTTPGVHPFDEVEWEKREASIINEKGELVFEKKDLEFPTFWSQLATNVTVSKYFHRTRPSPEGERSLKQLITRVAGTLAEWGWRAGYFATEEDRNIFHHELIYLLLHQNASFNSPVWFNVGIEEKPQCSACFINSVEDRMESILELAKTEGMLFKWGSGTGTNLSPIRSSKEVLSSGGSCSGPVSFMKGYDSFAGVIKSGGKTRRAAKMVILNIDHPDVTEFITCKAAEEKKAWILIDNGYDGSLDGEAYGSVFFQNSNNSVRVTDDFMRAVQEDRDWALRAVSNGEVMETHRARDLMRLIADSAHICGDPGIQFDTTINDWNTCPMSGRINASNPCSEFMFLDDSACNLASLNLMRYRREDGSFDVEHFFHSIDVLTTAQEIIVDAANYPTEAIRENAGRFRPLGLGYANLGALLMSNGLPYDSEQGRAYAAVITSLLTGRAYLQSSRVSDRMGPFEEYPKNREFMLRVIKKHGEAAKAISADHLPSALWEASEKVWQDAYRAGERHGFRNAQVTVLAPTGTIGFMMDCDTTGIEPDIALVKFKKLVGGGMMKIVNRTVPQALKALGYDGAHVAEILDYIDKNDMIEGAPGLKEKHLPVFDCAFKPRDGVRSIPYMGHLRMMGAVQPFISGAISKTVNMPSEAAVDDVFTTYLEAWKMGVKAVAIYRDGSKRTQPLSTEREKEKAKESYEPIRHRLPMERRAITHKMNIGGHEGYITVGLYEDGMPGEIFITMSKEGSVVSGLMDAFATSVSMALQYGVPMEVLCNKFSHMRFEPAGFTGNKEIPIAKSVLDYIFRWLTLKFFKDRPACADESELQTELFPPGAAPRTESAQSPPALPGAPEEDPMFREAWVIQGQADAPTCYECGSFMVRNGACYKCMNCGSTSGCS
ncbi:MAG: vitamin B12-dependent ribonucleotide reductase [Candidatus Eisenbacteria bacterium]|nr:vitamin B12-dependent ribonucleotide reductase [Candidatus Eisenbacteria bacterium]